MSAQPSIPRYAEIRRALEDKIRSGAWKPGARIPSEHELVAEFDCSRMTVNKAVSALAEAGLVVRRRRSGSFVAVPQSEQTVVEIHDIRREIQATGQPYRFEVLARRQGRASDEECKRLGLAERGQVVALTLVHYAADLPFVLEDRVIDLAAVPEAGPESFAAEPPGSWLLAHIPWSRAEHRIRAVIGEPAVTDALDLAPGAACLLVERRTWHAGTPITQVRLFYPGERHELVARFAPPDGEGGTEPGARRRSR